MTGRDRMLSSPFDPWPNFRTVVTYGIMMAYAYLTTLCRVVPAAVPTGDSEGGVGPPVLFVWHPEGEDEDHGVSMKVAADGGFDVALTDGMADGDLFRRLVAYCVAEGVPYEVWPCEPAAEEEGGA